MGTQNRSYQNSGFTIIEVVLFLAVTGMLVIGILAGGSIGISNQRYNDSVNTFKATLQEEFVKTTRVINSRSANVDQLCDTVNNSNVGASDCIVMGRLITISGNGELRRMNIVGRDRAPDAGEGVARYDPMPDYSTEELSTMNWGTRLHEGGERTIAIIRSPSTGTISVYSWSRLIDASGEGSTALVEAFSEDEIGNTTPIGMCIDPSGWTVAERKIVSIGAYASGPSAVDQRVISPGECS